MRNIKNWIVKTKQAVNKLPKKAVLSGMVVLILLIGVLTFLIIRSVVTSGGLASIKSDGGKITLTDVKQGMAFKNGSALNGSVQLQDNATLYYIVSSGDKRALGAGNITASKDTQDFSRNLTFDTKNYQGKDGELYVYIQDDKGKVLDGITVKVRLE